MSRRSHTIGFECELDGTDINALVLPMIHRHLWNHDSPDEAEPHYNHCDCDACSWGSSLLRPHLDCTCDGEIVSDILVWPSAEADALLTELAYMLSSVDAKPGSRAGFHVHVGHDHDRGQYADDEWCWECDTDPYNCECGEFVSNCGYGDADAVQKMIDYFTWYESQIAVFAKQSLKCVRAYNYWLSAGTPGHGNGMSPHDARQSFRKHKTAPNKGMTLALRNQTWEFRIWNSVTEAWRMHLAIEMSCAFVDAVEHAPPIGQLPPANRPPLLSFIAPHLSDTGLAYAARHLATPTHS